MKVLLDISEHAYQKIQEEGTYTYDLTPSKITPVSEKGLTKEPEIIKIPVNSHNAAREFEVFADAIKNDSPVETNAVEGAKTVEVCRAIVKSSVTGEIVKPNYNF